MVWAWCELFWLQAHLILQVMTIFIAQFRVLFREQRFDCIELTFVDKPLAGPAPEKKKYSAHSKAVSDYQLYLELCCSIEGKTVDWEWVQHHGQFPALLWVCAGKAVDRHMAWTGRSEIQQSLMSENSLEIFTEDCWLSGCWSWDMWQVRHNCSLTIPIRAW